MPSLTSKDGTAIAYDKVGNGPAIILINGALAHRKLNGEQDLAAMLSKRFTVFYYDRRGRGESRETKPYSVQLEIDDIEALINEAGGAAFLHGQSSGAALALLAASKLGAYKVKKLSLYEPPFDAYVQDGKNNFDEIKKTIKDLVGKGRPGDAIAFFFESIGTPPEGIHAIKQSPVWEQTEKLGHTLVHDFEILGDGLVPIDVARRISMPAQVLSGEKSFGFMRSAADTLAQAIPNAMRRTLKDQTHQAAAEALFPVISGFFSLN